MTQNRQTEFTFAVKLRTETWIPGKLVFVALRLSQLILVQEFACFSVLA